VSIRKLQNDLDVGFHLSKITFLPKKIITWTMRLIGMEKVLMLSTPTLIPIMFYDWCLLGINSIHFLQVTLRRQYE